MNGLRTVDGLVARFGLSSGQRDALEAYVDLLVGWSRGNVTGLRDRGDIVETLLCDALALLDVPDLLERGSSPWVDLGAGAGFPGIPLAVALPGSYLVLLDAASRKSAFLEEAVVAAGISPRARVVCARSEEYAAAGSPGRETAGVVLARAVAALPTLVELAAPLLRTGGALLASKTATAAAVERLRAASVAPLCGLTEGPLVPLSRSPLADSVCAVYLKVGPTPPGLPRRPGRAAKAPLAS